MNAGGEVTLSVKVLRFDWGQLVSDVLTDPIVAGWCFDRLLDVSLGDIVRDEKDLRTGNLKLSSNEKNVSQNSEVVCD